jgi:hypothetical protein
MAVKKTAKKDASATPTKASAKDTAKTPKKKAATKAAAAPKAAKTKAAKTKTAKTKTAKPKTAKPKAAKPKAAPVKLSASQTDLLKKVHGAGEGGYHPEKKIEERSLTSLLEKKLIKKGAKDKATGKVPHHVTASGKKHIDSGSTGGSSTSA